MPVRAGGGFYGELVWPIQVLNASRLVSQWAALHSAELMENWNRAQSGQTLFNIIPLDA